MDEPARSLAVGGREHDLPRKLLRGQVPAGGVRSEKLAAAAALLVVYAIGDGWQAWLVVACDAAVIALLCAWEAFAEAPRRVAGSTGRA